jgi:hypothetical protein
LSKKAVQLIPSIILYIAAGLVAAFALWAYTHSADIVSQAREAGQLAVSGNEYDIASFYMANSGQYFIYALVLAAAGLILQRKYLAPASPVLSAELRNKEVYDKELDEWFDEMDSIETLNSKDE